MVLPTLERDALVRAAIGRMLRAARFRRST
jgi:hypothetical protein